MSLLSWFSREKKSAKAAAQPDTSGLSRMDSTKPYPGRDPAAGHGKPANRKSERMARRELLYGVVRESMAKAGVLSASYKFKVLSLDARGRQFLIMVDLAREYGSETSGLAEIEAMIAQMAKVRYDIVVTAVYWRMSEHVAVGIHAAGRPASAVKHGATPSQAAPLAPEPVPAVVHRPLVSQPAPLEATAPLSRAGTRYEPIQSDEVEAFKTALAKGVSAADAMAATGNNGAVARSFDGSIKHGPQSYTLLTGFEDTELAEDTPAPGALSATQYGDLGVR